MYRNVLIQALLALAALAGTAQAAGKNNPLPEPLNLSFALSKADERHPALARSKAGIDIATANRDKLTAKSGFSVSLNGRLRWVDPASESPYTGSTDNALTLKASTDLYDFGRTSNRLAASESLLQSAGLLYKDRFAHQRLAIMQAYFNVRLADLEYIRDNQAMASFYVSYDRMRDRHKTGQVSDVELVKAEKNYQRARAVRYASDVRRRLARQILANLLNLPDTLSSNLDEPALPVLKRKLPSLEKLKQQVLAKNPMLKAYRLQAKAAEQKLRAAQAGGRPVIRAELETSRYSRPLGSNDDFRASITFDIPVFTNGRVQAQVSLERARLRQARARVRELELRLTREVLDTWNRMYILKARMQEMQALLDYRELALDRSRALYEMNARTTLGMSMVNYSDARLKATQVKYQLALMWEKMHALAGMPVYAAAPATRKTR